MDETTTGAADQPPTPDPLDAVRASLEGVGELPLAARAEVLDAAHRAVVAELRALELG